jgi:hypothetical protein
MELFEMKKKNQPCRGTGLGFIHNCLSQSDYYTFYNFKIFTPAVLQSLLLASSSWSSMWAREKFQFNFAVVLKSSHLTGSGQLIILHEQV